MKRLLLSLITVLAFASLTFADGTANNAGWVGSYTIADQVYFDFSTYTQSTGVPATLSASTGSATVQLYRADSSAPVTSGITLTTNFNSVTGLNHVKVDTTGFTAGQYVAVIGPNSTVGTSVAGYQVATFAVSVPQSSDLRAINGGSTGSTASRLELKGMDITPDASTAGVWFHLTNAGTTGIRAWGSANGNPPYAGGTGGLDIDTDFGVYLQSGSAAGMQFVSLANGFAGLEIDNFGTNGDAVLLAPSGTGAGINISSGGIVGSLLAVQKNVAYSNFMLKLVQSNDNKTPATGKMPACTISQDGGAFAACTNTPATEVSNGWYKINLTQTELNADEVVVRFTATGANVSETRIHTNK